MLVQRQRLGGPVHGADDRAGVHRADRVQGEGEAGDGAEVPAAAAQRPEQLRVLPRRDAQDFRVGGDDLCGEQVVAAQPEHAVQPADPAAQRDAAHADRGHVGTGHGQARRLGGLVHHAPGRAAADGGHAPVWVDSHRGHRGQVEHQCAVGDGPAGVIVPAAADADRQPQVGGEPDRRLDIGHRHRLGDERGPVIVAGIPHLPRGVVLFLSGQHDTPGQARAQPGDKLRRHINGHDRCPFLAI